MRGKQEVPPGEWGWVQGCPVPKPETPLPLSHLSPTILPRELSFLEVGNLLETLYSACRGRHKTCTGFCFLGNKTALMGEAVYQSSPSYA